MYSRIAGFGARPEQWPNGKRAAHASELARLQARVDSLICLVT